MVRMKSDFGLGKFLRLHCTTESPEELVTAQAEPHPRVYDSVGLERGPHFESQFLTLKGEQIYRKEPC